MAVTHSRQQQCAPRIVEQLERVVAHARHEQRAEPRKFVPTATRQHHSPIGERWRQPIVRTRRLVLTCADLMSHSFPPRRPQCVAMVRFVARRHHIDQRLQSQELYHRAILRMHRSHRMRHRRRHLCSWLVCVFIIQITPNDLRCDSTFSFFSLIDTHERAPSSRNKNISYIKLSNFETVGNYVSYKIK